MPDSVLRDKGGWLSPVIRRVEQEGRPAVLKDYRSKSFFARNFFGPYLVRREYAILKRLEGMPGVPRAYRIVEGRAILLEYIEGRTSGKFKPGELPPGVFDALRETVREIHRRGVVHLDLRQKKNILITADFRPCVIDFGAALMPSPASPLRLLLPKLRRVDEMAVLKFKQRAFPDLLTEAERKALARHRFWRRFWIFTPRGKYVR